MGVRLLQVESEEPRVHFEVCAHATLQVLRTCTYGVHLLPWEARQEMGHRPRGQVASNRQLQLCVSPPFTVEEVDQVLQMKVSANDRRLHRTQMQASPTCSHRAHAKAMPENGQGALQCKRILLVELNLSSSMKAGSTKK